MECAFELDDVSQSSGCVGLQGSLPQQSNISKVVVLRNTKEASVVAILYAESGLRVLI